MLILGIDPGTATTGYGLVRLTEKGNEVITWGLIETDKNGFKEHRLEKIFEETLALLSLHKPDVLFLKNIFATNAKTVIAVGQAQGVMLLAASKAKVRYLNMLPVQLKNDNRFRRANKKKFRNISGKF